MRIFDPHAPSENVECCTTQRAAASGPTNDRAAPLPHRRGCRYSSIAGYYNSSSKNGPPQSIQDNYLIVSVVSFLILLISKNIGLTLLQYVTIVPGGNMGKGAGAASVKTKGKVQSHKEGC